MFVVGPPPVGEPEQDERIRELSNQFAHVATHRGLPFVGDRRAGSAHDAWRSEAAANDGSHPGAGGYAALAEIVLAGGWIGLARRARLSAPARSSSARAATRCRRGRARARRLAWRVSCAETGSPSAQHELDAHLEAEVDDPRDHRLEAAVDGRRG